MAASALLLAGCASSDSDAEASGDRITVVASTDVYAQIAGEIGGEAVDVTAIVASAGQDPHSYEPSARDQLTVQRADLIIENGGGYDAFVDALIEASGSTAPVITAAEFSTSGTGVRRTTARRATSTPATSIRRRARARARARARRGVQRARLVRPRRDGGAGAGHRVGARDLSPDDADAFAANVDGVPRRHRRARGRARRDRVDGCRCPGLRDRAGASVPRGGGGSGERHPPMRSASPSRRARMSRPPHCWSR